MAVLHTHEFGDPSGVPLLAVHGVTGHGRRYRRLAEEALPGRRTLAVDLRGHGRSTYDGPWSIPQHVADIVDTLDSCGMGAIDVIGHSYGGAIALALLIAAPDRVRRLVLLDPALAQSGERASQLATHTIDDPGWATVEEATIARNAGLGDEINPGVVEDIADHLVGGEDGRFRFRYHKPAVVTAWGEVCTPLPDELEAVPALLVVADRAELVSPEIEAGLVELFGGTLDVVHLDSGHMLYWDRFDETAAAIASFLS
jgi:lipase